MTQYNNLNEKLSNLQVNKLKLGRKNGTDKTLKISSLMILIMKIIFFTNFY